MKYVKCKTLNFAGYCETNRDITSGSDAEKLLQAHEDKTRRLQTLFMTVCCWKLAKEFVKPTNSEFENMEGNYVH
jgi:hypothetical protein